MNRFRAILLAAGASLAAAAPAPVAAQIDGAIVLNIMRECAKINDANARLSCYDNNIRSAGATPPAAASFGLPQQNRNQNSSTPAQQAPSQSAQSSAGGFGSETLRTTKPEVQAQRESGVTATVAQAREREPGIYLLTLEDGAQWVFAEAVSRTYKIPGRGDTISIDRASLGSFTMRFNSQAVVRVRRVQ